MGVLSCGSVWRLGVSSTWQGEWVGCSRRTTDQRVLTAQCAARDRACQALVVNLWTVQSLTGGWQSKDTSAEQPHTLKGSSND